MKKVLIIVSLAVFLAYCGNGNSNQIKAPGIVDGDIITMKSKVSGTIEKLDCAEGKEVGKGNVIARFNSDKITNQIEGIEISLKEIDINRLKLEKKRVLIRERVKYLKKQVERMKRLRKSRSVAGEKVESMELKLLEAQTTGFELARSLEELETKKATLQNKMEYLNLTLQDHTISAPVSGVIVETFVSEGEDVMPYTAVADVLDTGSLYVEVFIEEGEIANLKLNQRAKIVIDGMEDKELSGVVTLFGKKAEFSPKYIVSEKERKALLYRVKIKIDKDIDMFKVGMPLTVVFDKSK